MPILALQLHKFLIHLIPGSDNRREKLRPFPQFPLMLRSSWSSEKVNFVKLQDCITNSNICRHRAELVYQLYLDAGHSLPSPLQVSIQFHWEGPFNVKCSAGFKWLGIQNLKFSFYARCQTLAFQKRPILPSLLPHSSRLPAPDTSMSSLWPLLLTTGAFLGIPPLQNI